MEKLFKDLIRASSKGDINRVTELLKSSVNVNDKDEYQFTPLIWACRKGHVNVVKVLVDSGADIEIGDIRNRTGFFHAVTYLRYDVISYLAEKNCNINPIDTHGWTPLDFALTNHNDKAVKLILDLGATSNRNR